MNKEYIKQQVGEDWFKLIDKALDYKAVNYIKSLNTDQLSKFAFYPTPNNIFECFKYTDFNNLKVVLLAEDPYTNGEATGLAFDVLNYKKIPLEFDQIEKAYTKYNPSHFNTNIMAGDLKPWAKQGILLLNSALTTEKSIAGKHSNYWEPFIVNLLKEIAKDDSIIFVSTGAIALKNIISADIRDKTITLEHPTYASKQNRDWDYKNFFQEVNDRLKKLNKKQIEW